MAVPEFLTVIEASRVLRIGRTVAYAETQRFRETDGREGIPCIAVGGQIRVPTAELERLAGRPINEASIAASTVPLAVAPLTERDEIATPVTSLRSPGRTGRRSHRPRPGESTLPFTG